MDDYLIATDQISQDIETIEENVSSSAITDDSETIYLLKRENLELRRAVAPLVPIAQALVNGSLAVIPEPMRPHFHDVGDHILRANDSVESYESLLVTMLQAHNARRGLQQKTDMRKIAAYAAMLAVPTAFAGIYGMKLRAHARTGLDLQLPPGPRSHDRLAGGHVPGVQTLQVAVM